VQDHIKGLNFSYRVQLREAGVTYLNKLGTFLGPNTMELVDNKGECSMRVFGFVCAFLWLLVCI